VQEKPVAPDVAGALRLARAHAALSAGPGGRRPVCAIAENYRSERAFREAAAAVRAGAVGDVIKLDLVADMPMSAGNKYFGSAWRRDAAACPGCFLMDSSVHFVAALRALVAAAGFGEAISAAGAAYGTADALPAPDALVGHVRFGGGRGAGVSISFGCALPRFALTATGTRGALEVRAAARVWPGWHGKVHTFLLEHVVLCTWRAVLRARLPPAGMRLPCEERGEVPRCIPGACSSRMPGPAVGTAFTLYRRHVYARAQVQRGGWAGGRGEYRLLRQAAGEAAPSVEKLAFSGLEDELSAFVAQVTHCGPCHACAPSGATEHRAGSHIHLATAQPFACSNRMPLVGWLCGGTPTPATCLPQHTASRPGGPARAARVSHAGLLSTSSAFMAGSTQ